MEDQLSLTDAPQLDWPSQLMTAAEVAAVLRITPKTVREHIRRGRLRALRIDGTGPYTNTLLGLSRKGSDYFTRDPQGIFLGERTATGRYYPIPDALGSVVAVTDSGGTLVGRHAYQPFGTEKGTPKGTPAFDSDIRFAGELYNSDHRLYKIGARWYDPKLGRWTQPDLIEQPMSPRQANRYPYGANNPVNNVDPTGLITVSLDFNVAVGPIEVGATIDDGFNVRPYIGGGGGLGFGPSISASFTESRPSAGGSIVGGGCVIACFGVEPGGASFGVGPKVSAGIFYRQTFDP
jgi:RHS repeat-associated protein/excisionase family DNA binding protein